MKPRIKGTPKELPTKDKPKVLLYTRFIPLKEDNLSTKLKDKTAGPEGVLIKWFHCINLHVP